MNRETKGAVIFGLSIGIVTSVIGFILIIFVKVHIKKKFTPPKDGVSDNRGNQAEEEV